MSARSFDITQINKNQANIRVSKELGKSLNVTLHSTIVFSLTGNEVTLSSGGWKTATTKTAINRAFEQCGYSHRVIQKKGLWFVEDGFTRTEFKDGMKIQL